MFESTLHDYSTYLFHTRQLSAVRDQIAGCKHARLRDPSGWQPFKLTDLFRVAGTKNHAAETVHFHSGDLERGNAAKGLPNGVGAPARGDWRLELTSDLDIVVTSYIRTEDGFLTSMHDLAPSGIAAQGARVPIFNPGSNRRQVSLLRVVNDGDAAATAGDRGGRRRNAERRGPRAQPQGQQRRLPGGRPAAP